MMIRNNPDPSIEPGTRIEIYLGKAEAMSIKPRMKGLKIWRPSPAEAASAAEKFGIRAGMASLYLLATEGFSGYVLSGRPAWREAVRDLEAPTLFDFGQPWPPGPEIQ